MGLISNILKLKSGKQILVVGLTKSSSSSSLYLTHHHNHLLGSTIKNFSTISESTNHKQQQKSSSSSSSNPVDKFFDLVAANLLNAIGKKDVHTAPEIALDDLFDKLLDGKVFERKASTSLHTPSKDPLDPVSTEFNNHHLKDINELLQSPKPSPHDQAQKFNFNFDDIGMHLTINNVSHLGTQHLNVFVVDDAVLVFSTVKAAATGQMLREVIELPQQFAYDPNKVTGCIVDGADLKISFPCSKEEKKKHSSFQVNLV